MTPEQMLGEIIYTLNYIAVNKYTEYCKDIHIFYKTY